jgi:hypothetical protein
VVDLAGIQQINAMRIDWADPYARKYLVQYFTGTNPIRHAAQGSWVTFSDGAVTNGKGGSVTLMLSHLPVATQFLRIWMTESSNTCDTHGSADKRNCVGYAIRELYAGTLTDNGFHDVVHHTADRAQTNTICSSVDPWHTASVINDRADQVGFDLFYTSGITRGLPAMIPIAMLYDTPENAAAEIAQFLTWRWVRSPTANIACRKTMPSFISNSRRLCIAWIQNSSWAARFSRA